MAILVAALLGGRSHLGVVVIGSSPEKLGAHLRSEMDKWGPVIREAGIKGSD